MKITAILLLAALLLSTCTSSPKPIEYGIDGCDFCKMTIVSKQHAAEAVTDKGKVYKFDAIECMVNYVQQREEMDFAYLLVNNYESPGELIDAKTSYYLISQAIPSPMGAFLSAFEKEASAKNMQRTKIGTVYDWQGLKVHSKENGLSSFSE